MDNVKQFFKDYSHKNVVFQTNDGLLFHEDGDAALHAKSLAIKTITTHLREVVVNEKEVATIPVINKIVTHKTGNKASENKDTITAQSLQPPVTEEVKEQLQPAEKADGSIVTDTTVSENEEIIEEVKSITTDTGETAANKAPAPAVAKKAATKKAAVKKAK